MKRVCTVCITSIALLILAAGLCIGAEPFNGTATTTVMLFPVAVKSNGGASRCAADMFLLIKERLSSQPGIRVVAYDAKNVSVQRMIREQKLDEKTADQFEADATGEAKAYKVCREMGISAAVLTSLTKYRYDSSTASVEIEAKLEYLDIGAQTPKKIVQATGIAKADSETASKTEEALSIQAVSNVVDKLFEKKQGLTSADLGVTMIEQLDVATAEPKKKDNMLPAMLGALLLGLLLSGGS
ncbi:MAG: hypothetical protein QME62_10595 [Armatimonadota bacterium]|nr:hypothetical protein [Armatimonadota bacterium]